MPRMAERLANTFVGPENNSVYELSSPHVLIRSPTGSTSLPPRSVTPTNRRYTIIDAGSGVLEIESEKNGLLDIIREANMDGVRHLKTSDPLSRYIWCFIIIIFVVLALIQIYSQLMLFYSEPVATNIAAEYPSTIAFPTVAICNNNQLTYITGARTLNRRSRASDGTLKSLAGKPRNIFEEAIVRTWDMDAVRFLRNAAHWKSRMILGCTWPNGTSCRLSDFKPVWTLTGLCWAINSDPENPLQVVGSGVGHSIRLLLNVENYERVDACTSHFRTKALPGLKILIYNQTSQPLTTNNGVNIPSGFAMDIRFRMQHHNRLPGQHCITVTPEHIKAGRDFNSSLNIRTCEVRKILREIEYECECSMARSFTNPEIETVRPCNVDDYFGCVRGVVDKAMEVGSRRDCLPPCDSVDYTPWQDLNRLPQNLMPALIEGHEEEDESDVEQDDMEEEKYLSLTNRTDEKFFLCEENAFLDATQVSNIKRDAHRAYEKQARHQEDIFLRTKRRIARLRAALWNVSKLKWGWHGEDYVGVYERLSRDAACFESFSIDHEAISSIMENRPSHSEEKRASQLFYLIDPEAHRADPKKFRSIGDLKRYYGDQVEVSLRSLQEVGETVDKMWRLFSKSTYESAIPDEVVRMDRVIELMTQYETGKLQRRVWAEKMQSKQMRHFFEDEFSEGWYQPIVHDLEHSLYKVILELEKDHWPKFQNYLSNGTGSKIGALLFFDTVTDENEMKFKDIVSNMYNCTISDVKKLAQETLKDFKKLYRELQSSYMNLFKKELTEYLENFEFGTKFVSENFAMVNVFLQQMHLERWSQDRTYGFWSLACDIGGALGLFLGASMLTIIELVYLCYQYRICGKIIKKTDNHVRRCWKEGCEHVQFCTNCQLMSLKTSYATIPEISVMDSPEERQKTSWINPLCDYSPNLSLRRRVGADGPLEDPTDAQRDLRRSKYEDFDDEKYSSDDPNPVKKSPKKESQSPIEENHRLTDRIEDDSGLESDEAERLRRNNPSTSTPQSSHGSLFEKNTWLPYQEQPQTGPRKFDPNIKMSLSQENRIPSQEEDENSQMTDSFSTTTPKLFADIADRQTTL